MILFLQSPSPKRIALFSIGNLCVYPECRKVYIDMNILRVINDLQEVPNQDSQIQKYAARILQKLSKIILKNFSNKLQFIFN